MKARNIKTTLHKVFYFFSVLGSYLFSIPDKDCPFCATQDVFEVANKLFFLKLFKCNQCGIMFRFPKNKNSTSAAEDYRLSCDFKINYLPKRKELVQLRLKKFKETVYDIYDKIELVKRYLSSGRLLDYGASWGYNLWQFLEEGFDGLGYEVSLKRAAFGEQWLNLEIIHDPGVLESLESHFDIVFANHVLEHIQDLRKELNRIYRLLKNGGLLFIFVPDCTEIAEKKWKNIFAFGEVHALAFTKEFFEKIYHYWDFVFLK